ncbi:MULTISPECIES: ATP-binding protein [unclassified Rhizobium]|uniref:ATP-binding protein n=1 Tax=unclassified Rhizobium TaxID=2613769 RepID=UPI000CDF519F|nr:MULTISPECIES: ATP-binding protein [Rhizobium]AVA21282.1 AAA ATPase domain-containing protein [Rhizobium sp. NXC24]UWU22450.1 ATP-binding protein [Rhizobium tropici]
MEPSLLNLRRASIEHLRSTMAPKDLDLSDFMANLRAQHCAIEPRDAIFADLVHAQKMSLLSPQADDDKERKILFVVGGSDAGKSKMIKHAIATDPAFALRHDEYGRPVNPIVRIRAPNPCSLRNIGILLLEAVGYPIRSDAKETYVWPLVPGQLARRGVMFVVIEEAQRVMKLDDWYEQSKVWDTLINLVDNEHWPVRLILAGMPILEKLREAEEQIQNRSKIQKLMPIPATKYPIVSTWIKTIISEHAGLELRNLPVDDVSKRLIHASEGNTGAIFKLIMSSVELVMSLGDRKTVTTIDFAQAYHNATGCSIDTNIFEQSNWKNLPSGAAKTKNPKKDLQNVAGKARKAGDRPR